MPFSIRTFSCVGAPSSSTLSDPRRLRMVPSSITVHSGLATCWPIRSLNAETFLRLKSASRPCPTASCSRTPGHPGPSTTVISPAGAGAASNCTMACRTASRAKCSGVFSVSKNSRPTRPPPPEYPRCGIAIAFARQHRYAQARQRLTVRTRARRRWWRPALVADCRDSWPALETRAWSAARAARSARLTSSTRSARLVSLGAVTTG